MNRIVNYLITAIVLVTVFSTFLDIFFSAPSTETPTLTKANHYVDGWGNRVSLSDFSGKYLWVDYAAEWCSYCEPQTRILKGLELKYADRVTFLTVITGTDEVMQSPTAETALKWANRFNLDPYRVLAQFSTNTLPYHILYSPSGEILHQDSGLYQAGKITSLLNSHTALIDGSW